MIKVLDLNFLGIEKAIASFLIETKDGPVLVETGPHSTFAHLCKLLEQHGHKPEDVKHVLLTHIHLDHAGAAWAFAQLGAKIYLHPFGEKHLAQPQKLMESAKRIYKEDMDRLWGQMNPIPHHQLVPMAHGEQVSIGNAMLTAWHTPGHANHHIAWQIDDQIFTGDVAGVKIGAGPVVPPCPPPDIDLESWKNAIQLLKSLQPGKLWLTHFGEVTDINEHFTALEARLNQYALWIKQHWTPEVDLNALTSQFEAFSVDDLKKSGVPDHDLPRYQAANPAWMSVAGLIRYWSKQQA